MLLELVQCGDLWPYIYRKKVPKFRDALPRSEHGNFEYADAKFYTANLVCALEYIHSLGIAYRDLKPEVRVVGPITHFYLYMYLRLMATHSRTTTLTHMYMNPSCAYTNSNHISPPFFIYEDDADLVLLFFFFFFFVIM
jgi:hypothetical protein